MAEVEVAVEVGAATRAQGVTRILQVIQAHRGQVTHRATQDHLSLLPTGQLMEFTLTVHTKIQQLGIMLTFQMGRHISLCTPTTRQLDIITPEDITQRCF